MEHYDDIEQDIKLPFEPQRFDIGEWVYNHSIGLCTTLIIYLIFAIIFITARISIETKQSVNVINIDLQHLAELERQRDELKKSVEMLQQQSTTDWSRVQNRTSNEASQLSEESISETEQLLNEAAENQRRMEANRAAYERGVAEAQAISNQPISKPSSQSDESQHQDANVKGNVTVSYSLINPIRHSRRLVVPAYLCRGGGEVKVFITVSPAGEVTGAKIHSGGDECMQQAALSSARASLFNIDHRAPVKQNGTITYLFIPQ